ncbi:Putative prophage lcu4 related protein [Latilactobacillus curvatus]|uniref:hypothetical protein n=1 Tax=Latilactobacillus curvatus TaxID=28038 RepID=UPI000A1AB1F0|nr:hypothetical protein [Latilactobacillus curvatus]SMH69018.1 Putative prophage lcu4 related protein [Latilactobacillus curvatus]
MTDLYIATPTQADYDALMRLAEAKGYVWNSHCKPTEGHKFDRYGCETVVRMRENMLLEYCDKPYYEDNQGTKIETIPSLSSIVAIYRTENMDWDEYAKTHPVSGVQPSLMFPCLVERNDGSIYFLSNHKPAQALAIEYKPKESEVMSEKVKLPKFMCDLLEGHKARYLLQPFTITDQIADQSSEANKWLIDSTNYWKLIDALRYGYEAEPEPRWGIKAGNCYMTNPENYGFDDVTPETAIENDAYWTIKSYADEIVKTLGFGEVADLNKEGKADD